MLGPHSFLQEDELKNLQLALQAMGAPANLSRSAPAPTPTAQHQPVQKQADTGVFGSQNKSTPVPTSDLQRVQPHPSSSCAMPRKPAITSKAPNLACPTYHQGFQYPEDQAGTLDSAHWCRHAGSPADVSRTHSHHHTCRQGRSQQPILQSYQQPPATQPAHYTVQEPESPCQPSNQSPADTTMHAAESSHPAGNHHRTANSSRHAGSAGAPRSDGNHAEGSSMPAGCLYSDTSIRRRTTPLKNGQPATAWSHEECITVRQIRPVQQADAYHMPWLQQGQAHIIQGKPCLRSSACCAVLATSSAHPVLIGISLLHGAQKQVEAYLQPT